jgi:hypothetical protein
MTCATVQPGLLLRGFFSIMALIVLGLILRMVSPQVSQPSASVMVRVSGNYWNVQLTGELRLVDGNNHRKRVSTI